MGRKTPTCHPAGDGRELSTGGGGVKGHVRQHLINDGVLTEQNVTRTPRQRHCRDCGRIVIAAITDLGFEAAVEPTPTTPAGELHVLLTGGRTYALVYGELVWRNHHRIEHRDANNETTHAMHECGKAPPEIHPAFLEKQKHISDSDKPPY